MKFRNVVLRKFKQCSDRVVFEWWRIRPAREGFECEARK